MERRPPAIADRSGPPEEKAAAPRWPRIDEPLLRNALATIVVAGAAGCVVVLLPGAWVLVGVVLVGAIAASLSRVNRGQLLTVLLALAVAATAVDYLAWRTVVANWSGWVIAGPLLAAEIFGALHTLGLQYTVFPTPSRKLNPTEEVAHKPIFVLIPTVNEGRPILAPTIRAALGARRRYLQSWPGARVTVAVCNDGRVANAENWRDTEKLAREMGVICITREAPGGNKAGNLEHARRQLGATGDCLIAVFDADQIARPEFLLRTVPPFRDRSVGWVQTGQYYRNLDQPVPRWANDQQALFYRVLCPGKAAHNAAFICGTNVVIRAAALDQIGGLPQDSVTEDFAASIRLHPRWHSVFLTEVLAEGLGPLDLPAYLKQQRRWATGTIGVLRTNWRDMLLPRRNGLRLQQRIQYGLACTHYFCGLRDLIYVLAPVAFLVTGIPAVRTASLGQFLWHFVPYLVASQAAFWYAGRGVTGLRGVVIGFGSFPALLRALFSVVFGRRSGFMVTSKRRRGSRSWGHLGAYVAAIVVCAAAVVFAQVDHRLRPESVAISVLWIVYDIALLAGVLWLGVVDMRVGSSASAAVRLPALRARLKPLAVAKQRLSKPSWLENPGAVTVATMLAATILIHASWPSSPAVFSVIRPAGQAPFLGLSLSHGTPVSLPGALARQLCLPFTIIGRTQDISDSFDAGWADQLASSGQRPWLTLQFGNFNADGSAPLDTSLPAIKNGVRDADLERWAQRIHAYGKPVYLTVLLHVDRNWAVTSAVANGGIPEDAPAAWEHVQSIFKAAGDTNVAWVWAPADPSQDKAYSPPESTIDAVLQSMIRYPDAAWPDPASVLHAVGARHPSKLLLVEVSAAGPGPEKAAWLDSIATAVASDPRVYGLVYHDGSPDPHATAADDLLWSLQSDSQSVGAVHSWQALVPTTSLPCGKTGGVT